MDLSQTLRSIVGLSAAVPADAFTASALGTERTGSGVLIDDGLVLTIGYLITEADRIWLKASDGRLTEGHALAIDQETGFGLVQALGRLGLPALELGEARATRAGDAVVLAAGEAGQFVHAEIIAKQEFAGYWEYLLDEAIFTAPALPLWGGAGLIGPDGRLIGIGSLLVQHAGERGDTRDANMAVPIDLIRPILGDLTAYGRVRRPARPWLGLFSAENDGAIVVASLTDRGPAAQAGIRPGDIVRGVDERPVESLAAFYRAVWGAGDAGALVTLSIERDGRSLAVRIRSADRMDFLKKPHLH